ncbi:MAG: hypothetical protein PHX27_00995 [Candidatus ainarchaeum sp.]|nr:hypothetical protein [Candidatus ainarchaeum sp.]
MNTKIKFIGIVFFLIALTSMVSACSINLSNINLGLRVAGDGDYLETLLAENNDSIDLKISFKINSSSGNCASNISAKTKIYRWNENTNDWTLFRTTSTKSATLTQDDYSFTWYNEFSVNSNYNRYKIEGIILEGSNELELREAYIDVEDNSCSGIKLIVDDFTIDEGRDTTKTFRIENNTGKNFELNNLRIYFTNSLIASGSADYSNYIGKYSNQNVNVTLRAASVSTNQTISGTFAISGKLGETNCSETQIGRQTFQTTVRETGQSNDYQDSSSECNDIRISTRNIEINENTSTKEIFYLENKSTKRFEITKVEIIDSGLNIKPFYIEQYAFPGNGANIYLELIANNAFSTKSYEQVLRVQGKFSDGKTCSYSNIGDKTFFVTINDTSTNGINNTGFSNCNGLTINVPSNIQIQNAGTMDYTITNNTGQKATIYLEGNAQLSQSMIVLPSNASISNKLTIGTNQKTTNITFRPMIEGCDVSSKMVQVNNTVTGIVTSINMESTIIVDQNNKIIRINFNNPTNKIFTGVLKTNLENQIINDKIITIPTGESFTEIIVELNKPIKGSIQFVFEGLEKTIYLDESKNNLMGLFAFGINPSLIGIIFLALILVAIIVIVTESTKTADPDREIWMEKETQKNTIKKE